MFEVRITSYAIALLISAAVSAVLALVVWRRRTAPGGMALFWLMLAIVEWQLTGACEAAAVGIPAKILWSKISYVGTLSAPVFLFIFALKYSRQEKWLTRRNLALLWLIPAITFALAVTNEWHHLIWTSFTPSADLAENVLIYGHGAWFWVMVAYVYLLLSTATLVLIRAALRYRRLYRRQATLVLLAMPFPWIGNILYVFNWGPFPGQDLTLIGFALTGALLTLNLYQFRLLDLVPVARDALIENMSDGVLVLDAEDRIVDINPAACQLIGVEASCIGEDVDVALAAWPELVKVCRTAAETQAEFRLGGAPPRYLGVHVSHLYDQRKLVTGRLIVLRDITERQQAEEEIRQHTAQLEALCQAGLHLTSTLELQPILEGILDHALKVVAADDAHIFLYDGERLAFGAALWADGHQQKPYAEPRPQGLTCTVARNGEPIVVPDVNSHPLFRDYQWGGAIVGLPLRIGERVVGVMNIAFRRPRAFDESELRVLGLLADQAAIAIENARLYSAQQHLAQERGNLLAIVQATTSTLDMTEVLRLVAQRAAQACGADRCTILLLDEEGKTLIPAMSQFASGRVDRKMWQLFKGTLYPRPLAEVPEAQQVFQEGRPLFIPDVLISSLPRYWIEPFNVKSLLVVPMTSKGRPIGVMGLDHLEEGQGFTAEQVNLAVTIGAQAAIAIENAKLYEETRRRATELGILYDVAAAAAASIRLDEVLNRVMTALQEIMRPDDVAILLLEPETNELVIRAHSGFPGGPKLMRRVIGVGIPGWVVQAGQPALLADVRQDERYHACDPDTRSELCVPLRVGERIIGAINLESRRLAAFSEEHLRLLSILAGHLAAVIENARLFEEIEGRRMYVEGVLGAAPDAIVTLDARHRIAEWNSGAERLFGYSREDVIGQDIDPLVTNPDVIEEATGFRQMVMGGEELPPVETVRYRKDGTPVDVLLAASPILVEDELIGVVTVYTDITERKRAEEALKDYSERLEEMVEQRTLELQKAYRDLRASQARLIQSEKLAATGRLAVSVAHEINNPLQGISNYLSVISQQVAQDDPLHEDLDMVKLGFERIKEIVRRLRAFYRPAGEEMEPTNINGVVERVLALVGHQLSLGNVEVKTELAEQELLVLGSAGQLEQVLVNLALNAQEAMSQGGELTVRTILHDDVVQLQVMDTGQGISEEEMSRLFKPFYSGKGGKGLGLGLWISHNIIEGHGGRIEVESRVGEGTTFTISLPAYQRER